MGAYLIDHPPVRSQFKARSHWEQSRPTGLTVIHTAENITERVGVDFGAENIAAFIQGRADPGSYHDIVDRDTAVWLVPYELGAYHDGTGSNGFGLSISFAMKSADWASLSANERDAYLRQGAKAFARQQAWLRSKGYPMTSLRRVTKAQSDAGVPGFIGHGERDPGRRSDPGRDFPWDQFFAFCAEEMASSRAPVQPDSEKEIPDMILIRNAKGTVALLGGNFVEWVGTAADHSALQKVLPQVQLSDNMFARLTAAANRSGEAGNVINS